MRCPGCGWEQPLAEACVVCGVRLVDRGGTAAEATSKAIQAPPGSNESRVAFVSHVSHFSQLSQAQNVSRPRRLVGVTEALSNPVSRGLMAVRAVAGAMTTAMATFILAVQEGVVLTPMTSLIVIVYGFVGLYWILSGLMTITLRQFLLEMLALLIVTVGLRVNLPEAFNSEQLRKGVAAVAQLGGTAQADAGAGQHPVDPAEAAFREQAQQILSNGKALLDSGVGTQDWMAWRTLGNKLRSANSTLSAELQKRTEPLLRKLVPLERAMELAVGASSSDAVDAAKKALDAVEKDGFLTGQ